jgi:hypothetical protein
MEAQASECHAEGAQGLMLRRSFLAALIAASPVHALVAVSQSAHWSAVALDVPCRLCCNVQARQFPAHIQACSSSSFSVFSCRVIIPREKQLSFHALVPSPSARVTEN